MKKNMDKSKGNKKKTIILCSVVVLLLLGGLGIGGYFYYQSKGLKVNLKKNITVNIFDEIYNTDGVKKIKNGTLISKKEKVDTSTLGDKKISLSIKDYFKKTKKYSYIIHVIDKEAPVINGSTKLSVEEGGEIDLLKDITVTDNSKEEIKATVEGEYDLKTPGVYSLNYVAKDSSGNESKTPFELEVTKKVVVATVKIIIAIMKAIISAMASLISAFAAGGWVAVLIIVILCVIAFLVTSIKKIRAASQQLYKILYLSYPESEFFITESDVIIITENDLNTRL